MALADDDELLASDPSLFFKTDEVNRPHINKPHQKIDVGLIHNTIRRNCFELDAISRRLLDYIYIQRWKEGGSLHRVAILLHAHLCRRVLVVGGGVCCVCWQGEINSFKVLTVYFLLVLSLSLDPL
jgi:hypothetical protein